MELRAALITFVILGILVYLIMVLFKPMLQRVWRYWCAIKAQDEEQRKDAVETERLRKKALQELESVGPVAGEPEVIRNKTN